MDSLASGGDELLRRFEAEWEQGNQPNLSEYLPPSGANGAMALALRLFEIDLLRRVGEGEEPPTAERYFHVPGFALNDAQRHALQNKENSLRETLPPDFADKFQHVSDQQDQGESRQRRRQLAGFNVDGLPILGSGGMGVVYRLKDGDLDREVAVKIILPDLFPQGCDRFENEARILARLQHPGVVPIHMIGNYRDGRPYFTMKIVEGQTLEKLLAARPSPAEDVTRYLDIFEQVCQTVAFAHSKKILHRDLKPGNVMVGAFGEVQVMDWGLGKLLDVELPAADSATGPSPGNDHATMPGHAMGTSAYAAPEQARGQVERISTRSDVFGLGAILCEILTGAPPYTAPHRLEKARDANLTEAWARLSACGADPELKEIVRKCLAPDQETRFAHAGEVAQRLADYRAASQQRLDTARLETEKATARLAAEQKALDAEKRRTRNARFALALGLALTVGAILSAWIIYDASKKTEDAVRRAARLAFGQGQALCEKGDIARGLFWFVRSLELGPNDKDLQDAARRQIAVWQTQIPALAKVWKEPTPVIAAEFHPSGNSFFMRFKDGSVAAYGRDHGKRLWTSGESDVDQTWLLAPSGIALLMVRRGGAVHALDTATGEPMCDMLTDGRVLAAAFRKAQATPLVAVRKQGQVWVYEGKVATQWPTEDEPIAAEFDASGRHLLIRSDKGLLCWHLPTKQVKVRVPDRSMFKTLDKKDPSQLEPTMRLFAALSAPIKDAAISPDGKWVVAARADHRIQIWSTTTGDPVFGVDDPSSIHENVSKVVFDATGAQFMTGNHESLAVWKATGEKVTTLALPRKVTDAFGFLALAGKQTIIFAQGEKVGFRLAHVSDHSAEWFSVPFAGQPLAVHPEGTQVLVADDKGTCFLWDIGRFLAPSWLPGVADVHAASYAEDGSSVQLLFRKEERRKVSLWQQRWDMKKCAALDEKSPMIDSDAADSSGPDVAAKTSDQRWSVQGKGDRNGELVFEDLALQSRIGPVVRCGAVKSIRFHPDKGKQVLIVGGDGRVGTLDLPTPRTEPAASIRRYLERVTGVHMDEAGNLVALSPEQWEAAN